LSPSAGQQQQQQHILVGPGSARRRSLSFGAASPPTMAGSPNGNTELTEAAEESDPTACRHPWHFGL
jgi:hypothetical protein